LSEVKLNFGLSPENSVQLKVSLAERKAKSKVKVTQCVLNKYLYYYFICYYYYYLLFIT